MKVEQFAKEFASFFEFSMRHLNSMERGMPHEWPIEGTPMQFLNCMEFIIEQAKEAIEEGESLDCSEHLKGMK